MKKPRTLGVFLEAPVSSTFDHRSARQNILQRAVKVIYKYLHRSNFIQISSTAFLSSFVRHLYPKPENAPCAKCVIGHNELSYTSRENGRKWMKMAGWDARILNMYEHLSLFSRHFYKGEQLPRVPVFFSGGRNPYEKGSSLKGKNLLLEEQILSLKS